MKVWVAIDIGCIECGQDSSVIGIYPSPDEAEAALIEPRKEQEADWHGQHSFEVHESELSMKIEDGEIRLCK